MNGAADTAVLNGGASLPEDEADAMPMKSAPAVVAMPVVPECVSWLRETLGSLALPAEQWSAEHEEMANDFLASPGSRRLLAFIDPVLGLTLQARVCICSADACC